MAWCGPNRDYVTYSTPFPCQLQCQQYKSDLEGVNLSACLSTTHQQLQVTSTGCDMTALNEMEFVEF